MSKEERYVRNLKKKYPDKPKECLHCKLFLDAKSYKIPMRLLHTPINWDVRSETKYVLFIAQNPGKEEDEQNEILVGKTGKLLLEYIHEYFKDYLCFATNAVSCFASTDDIKQLHIRSCAGFTREDIEEVQPDLIIWLGRIAKESYKELYD